ncbi:MAG: type II toxin-antitoxin system HicA family toxin [Patescibacteria group bacterium]
MKRKTLSGSKIVKVLTASFEFEKVRQRGSHIVLRKFQDSRKIITIVPNHREVDRFTLKGVLELAEIKEEDFWEKV